MKSITQDVRNKQSLMEYSLKYGVSKASRKYNRARSYIYFWLKRYDGTLQSLQRKGDRLLGGRFAHGLHFLSGE